MKNQPIFEWDAELGLATCILTDGENVFYGTAQCHEDDSDMKNEKTGCEIAFRRARIDSIKYYRDERKTKLAAVNQLYYSINKSKKFNPNSYEAKMLRRQIRMYESDLAVAKEMLVHQQESLIQYIKEKDEFYKHIRANRAKADKNN